MTVILRIEHPVPDFDAWKRAFDSDPVSREQGGEELETLLEDAFLTRDREALVELFEEWGLLIAGDERRYHRRRRSNN